MTDLQFFPLVYIYRVSLWKSVDPVHVLAPQAGRRLSPTSYAEFHLTRLRQIGHDHSVTLSDRCGFWLVEACLRRIGPHVEASNSALRHKMSSPSSAVARGEGGVESSARHMGVSGEPSMHLIPTPFLVVARSILRVRCLVAGTHDPNHPSQHCSVLTHPTTARWPQAIPIKHPFPRRSAPARARPIPRSL